MDKHASSEFPDSRKFVYRVCRLIAKKQRIAFLLGSGVTAPYRGNNGVPTATEIVSEIEARFTDSTGKSLFCESQSGKKGADAYQSAMKLLVECEGQPALNDVITHAVLKTYTGPNSNDYEQSELAFDNWVFNSALESIAALYVKYPDGIGPILTSNFDPLAGIAIKRAGGQIEVHPISEDGSLFGFESSTSHRRVVHFHGYWRGVDTLHTADQITRNRPKLAGDLRKLLNSSTLVVLGYGGWNDVFMDTLSNIIAEGATNCNVLWGFFENDQSKIESDNSALIKVMAPQLGSRVVLYKGIDVHEVLPQIAREVNASVAPLPQYRDNLVASASKKQQIPLANDPGCDALPESEYWTGRIGEMNALSSEAYKVAILSGIGGQGKSCLASVFLSEQRQTGEIDFWDWRDCKEERNRMQTNLASICLRLSSGSITSDALKDEAEGSLIELLFNLLSNKKAIFVFDNVDEYIDLKTLQPRGAIKTLIEEAEKRHHSARFIFTCRPQMSVVGTQLLQIPVAGFNKNECRELFGKYNTGLDAEITNELADRSCLLTNGHPFWINIIAAQAVIGASAARTFMEDLTRSDISSISSQSDLLAEKILSTVWLRLNEKNRVFLRALAEAVREETKERLVSILEKELNYNAINKSLKKLRQLNLVVVKYLEASSVEYFDLHPLVKRFVRAKITPEQRNRYISLFVAYFEGVIIALRPSIGSISKLSDFRNWSYKIELEVNRGRFPQALEALQEVASKLDSAGFVEEYIRIAEYVLNQITWTEAVDRNWKHFDTQVCTLIEALSEIGRYQEADSMLEKLANSISGSGVSYLRMKNAASKRFWHSDDFSKAIIAARECADLKVDSGADVDLEVTYNLALALRDSKSYPNVLEALTIFLHGHSLEDVLIPNVPEEKNTMHYFGNIGRCLQFLGKNNDALRCYYLSLNADDDENSVVISNRAYAFWWVGELFEATQDIFIAAHFYKLAGIIWMKISPPRSRKMNEFFQRLVLNDADVSLVDKKSDIEIRSFCNSKLSQLFEKAKQG